MELLNKPTSEWTADDAKSAIEIFKILTDMADKVSQRRQAANSFYLTINSALIGSSAYFSSVSMPISNTIILTLAGFLISLVWLRNISSYKTLNEAKFKVINEFEKNLICSPFAKEWSFLDRDGDGVRHRPFHSVEIMVPLVFMLLHAIQSIKLFDWTTQLKRVCAAFA